MSKADYYVATNYVKLLLNSPDLVGALEHTFGDSYRDLLEMEYIRGSQLQPVFELLAAQGLDSWALRFGSRLGTIAHGPLSFAALSAPDLLTALNVLADYSVVRSNAYSSRLIERDGQLTFLMIDQTNNELVGRWLIEVSMQIILRLVETVMTHSAGHHVSIKFAHPAPSYASRLDAHYQARCVYKADEYSLSIPASWGQVSSPLSDAGSFSTNLAKCKEIKHLLDDNLSLAESVRFKLEQFFNDCLSGGRLPSKLPTLNDLAADFALSPRTFSRRLKRQQSSYKIELERVRKLHSQRLLSETHFSIADIAYYLAYQEPANFTRAFKGWFGVTPNHWRRRPEATRKRQHTQKTMTNAFDLDHQRLADYLARHIDGFSGPLSSEKFAGGQSNPTYLLSTPDKKYVLRRKPPGKLLPGAHAVDREYKILSALAQTNVPVAGALHLCADNDVIGSVFYVMQHMNGRVLWDPTLPDQTRQDRREIYEEMNRVLAELHKVNIDEVGLSDFGKKGAYFERQTNTWTKQYRAAETQTIKPMDALIDWLPANMPADDGKVSIAHGDYRLDNMMFHGEQNSVIALLDWELSTIGHPYADLAYQCMQYYLPRGKGMPGLAGIDLEELGIPSEQDYVAMYCQRMGFDNINNWHFYLAFSLFRLAAICQGIEKRRQIGTASSEKAAQYGALVEPLATIAIELTE